MTVQVRNCTLCGETKPATTEFFYRHPGCRFGVDPRCKACRVVLEAEWRRNNRELKSARKRADHANHRDVRCATQRARTEREKLISPFSARAKIIVHGLQVARVKRGIFVDPLLRSKQFFIEWLQRQPNCACCGILFELFPKGGRWSGSSPSLDRFYPERGYARDNVSLICWRCNNIKRNYSADDLLLVAKWMDSFEASVKSLPPQGEAA